MQGAKEGEGEGGEANAKQKENLSEIQIVFKGNSTRKKLQPKPFPFLLTHSVISLLLVRRAVCNRRGLHCTSSHRAPFHSRSISHGCFSSLNGEPASFITLPDTVAPLISSSVGPPTSSSFVSGPVCEKGLDAKPRQKTQSERADALSFKVAAQEQRVFAQAPPTPARVGAERRV